jgi:hypothetical protein
MKYLLIIICFLYQSSCKAGNPVTEASAKNKKELLPSAKILSSKSTGLNIDLSSLKQQDVNYIGFNVDNTFGTCNISDTKYTGLIDQMSPAVLRFPGGSISNFYHPEGKGNGFKPEEFILQEANITKNLQKLLMKNEKLSERPNFITDFTTLAKHLQCEVIYVANITSGSISESLNILKHFKDNGIKVRGVELGNELYLTGYKQIVPDASKYIELAVPFANAIKSAYPDIPIAIPAESRGIEKPNYNSAWNSQLSQASFYDAIVVHVYPDEPECPQDNLGDMFNCSLTSLTNFANNSFPTNLSTFSDQFRNKRIWITEWNMKKPGKNIGSTVLQALYAADFFLELNDWNKNNSKLDIAMYHNLSADEFGYSLVNPKDGGYVANTAFYTFKLLSVLAKQNWKVSIFNQDDLKIGIFYNESSQKLHVFILNENNKTIPLSTINITNKKTTVSTLKTTMESFNGTKLYTTSNETGFINGIDNFKDSQDVRANVNSFQMNPVSEMKNEIQPYSFTRISFDLKP